MKSQSITAALTYSASYDSDRNEAPFEVQTEIVCLAFVEHVNGKITVITIDRAVIRFQARDHNGNIFMALWSKMPLTEPECDAGLIEKLHKQVELVFTKNAFPGEWPNLEPILEPAFSKLSNEQEKRIKAGQATHPRKTYY